MSAVSKHWNEIFLPGVNCTAITHPGKRCSAHLLLMAKDAVWGNVQFFLPISILRLFLLMYTRKTVSWDIARQALFEFTCCVANGWAVANSWAACFCGMYHWFGRIINNYSVSLPGLLGTLVIFWTPEYVKMSHSRAIFNVFLECWIKSREHPLVEYARESKVVGTMAFMAISAAIGYCAQRTKIVEFWFFSPIKKNLNSESKLPDKPCLHRHTCQNYIVDGMKTCFTFGMVLELARKLIASAPEIRHNPPALFTALLRLRFRFVAFLTLYNGLFRFTTCLLARFRRNVSENDSTLAGFISGLSYAISPNYNVFNLAATAMLQNIWNFISEKYARLDVVRQLDRLSLSSITWILLMNYNMYARACYPYAMSKFALKFTDICSNSLARAASENLAKQFLCAS